jgi:hypothetical protein
VRLKWIAPLDEIDELRRQSVLAENAYLQAKRAYLVAVETSTSTDMLGMTAEHVASAAHASATANWELCEALEGAGADEQELVAARSDAGTSDTVAEIWDELVAAHEGRLPHPEEQWRPLTQREHEIMELLLSVEFPGVDELRTQARVVKARRLDRNSPTVELQVDPMNAPPAELACEPVAVETETRPKARAEGRPWYELYLFASKGYMYELHIGGEYDLDEFPAADLFATPRPCSSSSSDSGTEDA